MNSSVITFPGSNCDRDMDVALKKFGFKNKMVWHDDVELPKSDLVVLPGGFSYGDYLRCGSMASKSKIMQSVINFAKGGVDFERSPYTPARSNGATTDSVNIRNRRGFVPRKMFLFQGCTPINMRPERYGYSPEGQVDRRDTEWSFRRYQVMSPREFANNMDSYHVSEEQKTRKRRDDKQMRHIF